MDLQTSLWMLAVVITYYVANGLGKAQGRQQGREQGAVLRVTIAINGDDVGGFAVTDGETQVL